MLTASFQLALLATISAIEARSVFDASHLHGGIHRRQNNDLTATVLAPNALQTGSQLDGSKEIGAAEVGQALSLTSNNNFINNCAGKVLTNGLQIVTGSCNGIPMGDIPAKSSMVSSVITFPLYGSATIQSDTTFNITVQTSNLVAGSFTNADATYYAAPQQLQGGKVVGHTHVTVQDMGKSLNPTQPLDATQFAFFKGINDAGNGNGLLQAVVTGGLPAGNYRVCTMASSSNHQPVLMPVAQRGTPDDCSKFTVVGSGTVANDASNNGAKGQAAAAAAQSAVDHPGNTASGAAAASTSVAASSAIGGKGKGTDTTSSESLATTSAKGGKGADTTSSVSLAATSAKGGKGADTTSSVSLATTSAKGGKGGKDISSAETTASIKVAPFSNTTISVKTTAKAGNGKGGNGGKAASTTAEAVTIATTSSTSVSVAAATTTSASSGGKGKGGNGGKATTTAVVVHKVTVIETFFIFVKSLGGLPPSVGKQGNSFAVLEELFDDLASAAAAACGHQFTACASFSGPNFAIEECESQKVSCGSAASTATASATPATVTATVTVPVSATVTGSVISESTATVVITTSAAASAATTEVASSPQTTAIGKGLVASSESSCSAPVTHTVTVDPPATTAAPVLAIDTASACTLVTSTITVDEAVATAVSTAVVVPFSNSTSTASASSASSSSVSGAGAIGGIAAPAVENSGDATRPFLVNGNTFVNEAAALQRSCDIQFNACANAVNGGTLKTATLADCSAQQTACGSASA